MTGSGARPGIVVVGSANADLLLRVPDLPRAGDTVLARSLVWLPGGKGANQAAAAARLGGAVSLVAAVGEDAAADVALTGLRDAGVSLSAVRRVSTAATGVATICVDDEAENHIVVAPGANARLYEEDLVLPPGTAAVLVSLEIPVAVAAAALAAGRAIGAITVLNTAPVEPVLALPALVDDADVVIANQGEAASMAEAGVAVSGTLVITLGADGATATTADQTEHRMEGRPVEAIDTVGAGDCFAGALTVALADGAGLSDALAFAVAASSLAVTRPGARTTPTLPEFTRHYGPDIIGWSRLSSSADDL